MAAVSDGMPDVSGGTDAMNGTPIDVVLDGDRDRELRDAAKVIHVATGIGVVGLSDGAQHGRSTVLVKVPLADGRVVCAEVSLKVLVTAVDALRSYYGDPI
jgi:hypothetical protein